MKKRYIDYDDESYEESDTFQKQEEEFGCNFCWDKRRKQSKELYFFDAANNMRLCIFCPFCGRNLKE